jgi:hypothetical protein
MGFRYFMGRDFPQIYFLDCLDNLACGLWMERLEIGLCLLGDAVIGVRRRCTRDASLRLKTRSAQHDAPSYPSVELSFQQIRGTARSGSLELGSEVKSPTLLATNASKDGATADFLSMWSTLFRDQVGAGNVFVLGGEVAALAYATGRLSGRSLATPEERLRSG